MHRRILHWYVANNRPSTINATAALSVMEAKVFHFRCIRGNYGFILLLSVYVGRIMFPYLMSWCLMICICRSKFHKNWNVIFMFKYMVLRWIELSINYLLHIWNNKSTTSLSVWPNLKVVKIRISWLAFWLPAKASANRNRMCETSF